MSDDQEQWLADARALAMIAKDAAEAKDPNAPALYAQLDAMLEGKGPNMRALLAAAIQNDGQVGSRKERQLARVAAYLKANGGDES